MAVIRKTDWAVNTGPVEYDTVNGQAVPVRRVAEPGAVMGDWKCLNSEWHREPLVVAGRGAFVRSEDGWFVADACGVRMGRSSCPDAAREAADAYLVSQGRLDKSRAFVRLGEWVEDSACYFRERNGTPWYHAYAVAQKAKVDAELVGKGLLDPSRAYKAGPTSQRSSFGESAMMASALSGSLFAKHAAEPAAYYERIDAEAHMVGLERFPGETSEALFARVEAYKAWPSLARTMAGPTGVLPNTATRMPPRTYNGEPAWVANVAANVKAQHVAAPSAVTAKPAWGEWELRTIHFGKEPYKAFLRASSVADSDLLFAKEAEWGHGSVMSYPATDIDDAREKADAFLVARGELEAGRAFIRLTDWTQIVPGDVWHRVALHAGAAQAAVVASNGWETMVPLTGAVHSCGSSYGDAGKAAADAELVRRGLLAESRAFKVAEPFTFKGSATYTYTLGPSAPGACEVSHDDGVTWEQARTGVTLGPKSQLRYKASPRSLTGTPTMQPGTYREIVFAKPCVTDQTTVTLANWEQCLPHLLSSAPREFRDGFNRKQGPAWEAYLRALAWVKEQIQCKRVAPHMVATAVVMATGKAHGAMGPEWVKANVR